MPWYAYFSATAKNSGFVIYSVLTENGFREATHISTHPNLSAGHRELEQLGLRFSKDLIALGQCWLDKPKM